MKKIKKRKYKYHTFVVMTGKNAPYLENCLRSLKNQILKSNIIIYTSQTSKKIFYLSKKFNIKLIIKKRINIATDWNNALKASNSNWVTLAHDDDIYHKNYFKEIYKVIKENNNIQLVFTNYLQIKNNKINKKINFLLFIKKVILFFGFFYKNKISNKILKKNILLFGSTIPCPSVTYNRKINNYKNLFNENYKINLDWDCWLNLALKKGSFYWLRKNLFFHRIHNNSVTSKGLFTGLRQIEDIKILQRIWPAFMVKIISKLNYFTYYLNR
jgi:hypothetical protein